MKRLIFAFLLSVSGTGCVYKPVASPELKSAHFGDGEHAEFQIGKSSRAAIISKFGVPSYSTKHDLACGYLFAFKKGTASGLLGGPCMPYFGSTEVMELDDVWLEFDRNGILKRIEKRCDGTAKNAEIVWRKFIATVPDQPRAEQLVGGHE